MSQAPGNVPDHVRTLDTFAAVALLAGLTVDDLRGALPDAVPLPGWIEACRTSREARAATIAPHLYRLQISCAEASKWP